MCLKVGKLAEKDYAKNRRDGTRYEFVTLIINHLLHEFIELTRIMNPRELGRLGQEIFDLSCYAAYGDEFIEDMEIMRQEMGGMMPTNDYEARMMAEFAHFKQNGGNLSFEDFAKRFKKNNPIEEYQPSGRVGDNGSSDVEYDNYDDDDDIEAEQLLNHNDDYFLF